MIKQKWIPSSTFIALNRVSQTEAMDDAKYKNSQLKHKYDKSAPFKRSQKTARYQLRHRLRWQKWKRPIAGSCDLNGADTNCRLHLDQCLSFTCLEREDLTYIQLFIHLNQLNGSFCHIYILKALWNHFPIPQTIQHNHVCFLWEWMNATEVTSRLTDSCQEHQIGQSRPCQSPISA